MQITIRNRRVLRWLGFDARDNTQPLTVGLSLRNWGQVLWRRLDGRGMTPEQLNRRSTKIIIAAIVVTILNAVITAWQLYR